MFQTTNNDAQANIWVIDSEEKVFEFLDKLMSDMKARNEDHADNTPTNDNDETNATSCNGEWPAFNLEQRLSDQLAFPLAQDNEGANQVNDGEFETSEVVEVATEAVGSPQKSSGAKEEGGEDESIAKRPKVLDEINISIDVSDNTSQLLSDMEKGVAQLPDRGHLFTHVCKACGHGNSDRPTTRTTRLRREPIRIVATSMTIPSFGRRNDESEGPSDDDDDEVDSDDNNNANERSQQSFQLLCTEIVDIWGSITRMFSRSGSSSPSSSSSTSPKRTGENRANRKQ